MIVFGCFTVYSLRTVVIQLHIYFTDRFLGGVLVFVMTKTKRGLLVFEITKTNTPEFTVKFHQKLGGKDRTEDNLTD